MRSEELNRMNTTSLAYLGDAVFEVIIREKIVCDKPNDAGRAHHTAVRYVSAGGQAAAARIMLASGFLTEEEAALLKRARNHRSMSRPQHADPKEYKLATGFEALLGYLYLKDERDRLREIAAEAVRIVDAASRTHTVK
ncbi:MAG: Mini-ribonuclease 3 [Mogibacterium sp.]|nr:Mini-ribonuclease 3 [Mogibacterium sp.]